ncbi:mycothiol transferase [Streptomyces hydrogenans]|uniref:mycothiol transferase n=1 Tax=Streptomyces hydrogenans TaxID=1873719 RepID=UPI0035DA160F
MEDGHFARLWLGSPVGAPWGAVVDLIEEYARHAGHADLIRESVDGLTGEDPPR